MDTVRETRHETRSGATRLVGPAGGDERVDPQGLALFGELASRKEALVFAERREYLSLGAIAERGAGPRQ